MSSKYLLLHVTVVLTVGYVLGSTITAILTVGYVVLSTQYPCKYKRMISSTTVEQLLVMAIFSEEEINRGMLVKIVYRHKSAVYYVFMYWNRPI